MNPSLKLLIEIQQLDNVIRDLENEIQSLPKKVAGIESQLASHIAQVESDKARVAENQRSRRKRETDIGSFREKISKHKDQMLEVKTNEQYKALLHEIEFHEAAIRKLEDEILTEMIESDSFDKQLKKAEQNLAAERAQVQIEVREAEQRKQQDDAKLQEAKTHREAVGSQLSPDVLFSYERIYVARKGTAVTPVREEACGHCHVRLRPQAFNDVKANEEILHCESCTCIMYYVEPPPEAPAAQAKTPAAPPSNTDSEPAANSSANSSSHP
jgi:predicted  nucleic acid-binding Zn-ribbon protein